MRFFAALRPSDSKSKASLTFSAIAALLAHKTLTGMRLGITTSRTRNTNCAFRDTRSDRTKALPPVKGIDLDISSAEDPQGLVKVQSKKDLTPWVAPWASP